MREAPVVIAGGGPVGLCLGIALARAGHPALLAEEREGPTPHPKATLLGARSMEHFRAWDRLDERVHDAAMRQEEDYFILFCTRLASHELHRFRSPGLEAIRRRDPAALARFRELAWSPYGKTQIGQGALEPVLLDEARRHAPLELRQGWRLDAFRDTGDEVLCDLVRVADGTRETVRARFLAGCDGGGSLVRRTLGVRFGGRGRMRSNVSHLFRAPGFLEAHGKGLANLYFCLSPGSFGVFTAIDGREVWNYQHYWADPTREAGAEDAATVLHRAMGRPFAFDLLATTHWHHHQSVAHRWRQGRVFLAGDAAHLFVPTGGVGMNTGIGDAVDLAWKLAAALEGWGGEGLLDSYEAERKPVAWRNSVISANNSDRIDLVMAETSPAVAEESPEGAAARAALRARIPWMARQFNSAGTHLGYRYADSPVIVPDGTPEPPDDPMQLVPSTWPGMRVPHAWLPDGRSTLDLLDRRRFTLLTAPGAAAPRLVAALECAGMPLAQVAVGDPAALAVMDRPLVLVRPDGHVGWRGADDPAEAEHVARRLAGREMDA
jgi:2-polyprenyl-6-methoxyphenol hydroxylase-like FAD-dependent oxidoreductase